MDGYIEALRVYDYTVKATLGLSTQYAKIGLQLENEREYLPASAALANNGALGDVYSSPKPPYKRHSSSSATNGRRSQKPLHLPADGMGVNSNGTNRVPRKRKGAFDTSTLIASDSGSGAAPSQLQSPANTNQRSSTTRLDGRARREKRIKDVANGHSSAAGKGMRLKSAFARVRPEKSSRIDGDSALMDGGAIAEAAGRRNKSHANKVNTNAANYPGIADERPKEYGEVWFDRYLIIAKLGEGAFSQAFLAADLYCNRMGRRHDGIRLVTVKRMGVKEGAIGISDYETISMLNRLDPKERIPIVRIYNIFLHRSVSQRTVEYDFSSRQLLPVQFANMGLGRQGLRQMADGSFATHLLDGQPRLRVFGGRAGTELSRLHLGSDTLTSCASIEHNDYHVCLVMEPLLGCTLHDAFPRRIKALYAAHEEAIAKQMHMDMIRTVVRQLLVALAHMHSNSLIHADIKTTNVICVNDTSLKVKLIDFGNSVSDGDVSEYYSTFEIQTVWFRAPEVAYQRPFGRAIDIWSIGCIMCELWLGRSLFTDMDNPGLIHSILKLRGPPPAQLYSASPIYLDIARSWNGRATPGFAPAVVGGKHKSIMHPEMNIDWDPQLRMQWLKHSLHVQDDDFVSLADALLEYDPEERLTAAEALEHPFFQGMYAL
ncbi:hypothetical protein GGI25_000175 [Coemansia spiralis]|uniref:Protein kinase domain-containing protein n=2 Tax=Coemansia TaxID=4863 RepID=A0A9W8L0X2_9FUNG|nr:hypothetical protein EDC05_002819 [Coemansia umbellata]KAJ2621833.1 hypothetical protein GGI26_003813 [Coemansia sp. RSA 1358]KAJ2681220.1 hypothetical protein GGI25_000175 [Coemansia spiralis]